MDMDSLEADFELTRQKGAEDAREAQRLKEEQEKQAVCNGDDTSQSNSSQINGKVNGDGAGEAQEEGGDDDKDGDIKSDQVSDLDTNSRSAQPTPMETDEDSKDVVSLGNEESRGASSVQEEKDDNEEVLLLSDSESKNEDSKQGDDDIQELDKIDEEREKESKDEKTSHTEEINLADKNDDDSNHSLHSKDEDKDVKASSVSESNDQNKKGSSLEEYLTNKKPTESSGSKEKSPKSPEVAMIGEEKAPSSKVVITVSESRANPITTVSKAPSSVIKVGKTPPINKGTSLLKTSPGKPVSPVAQSENMRPMAKALYDLGLDLARQQVYKDLIKIQNKKHSQSKLGEKEQKQLDKLKVAYDNIVSKNEPYELDPLKCTTCGFNTESSNVMELHREYAHHSGKNGSQNNCECTFCDFVCAMPGDFFVHMEKVHRRRGRIHMRMASHVCPYCPFENNSKRAFQSHIGRCEKNFHSKTNLVPAHADCDIPLVNRKPPPPPIKPAPVIRPPSVPATKVNDLLRRPPLATPVTSTPRTNFNLTGRPGGITPVPSITPTGQQLFQVGSQLYTLVHNNGQAFLTPFLGTAPTAATAGVPARTHAPMVNIPTPPALRPPPQPTLPAKTQATMQNKSVAELLTKYGLNVPQQKPIQKAGMPQSVVKPHPTPQHQGSGFEICEICGGFVKDKESLRVHFFYAHKVEIPVEVFRNKQPHLICDICQKRFWTYQGMVRHTQMVHESKGGKPNKAGLSCAICGEKNLPMGLLGHLVAHHNVSIRKLFEANKCFLCKATFPVHFLLKMHMTRMHNSIISSSNVFNAFLKSLGLSKAFMPVASVDTSQSKPVPTGLYENSKMKENLNKNKKRKSLDSDDYVEVHPSNHPHKCSRCFRRFPYPEILQKHYNDTHRNEKEECLFCKEHILIGRPYVRHMKREHFSECSVVLQRLPKQQFEMYMEKKRKREEQIKEKVQTVVLDDDEDDMPLSKRMKKNSTSDEKESQEKKGESDKENDEKIKKVEGESSGEKEGMVNEEQVEDSQQGEKKETSNENNKDNAMELEASDDLKGPSGENAVKVKTDANNPGGEVIQLEGETIVVQKQQDCL